MKEHVKNTGNGRKTNKSNDKKQNNEKKPFDKKKYRLQKYSNKYKLNQWEERRKKAVLRDYYKEVEKSEHEASKKPFARKTDIESENKEATQPKKMSAFHKAKQEFLRKKDEKRKKREEIQRIKSEKADALKKYKEKKMQTYKQLSKKTKKGQPVMKGRLEMLLAKIQGDTSS